jgi:sensor domain CHASE-containing protein
VSQQQDSESDSYYDGDDWRFFDGNLGSDTFDNDDLDIIFDGEREVL